VTSRTKHAGVGCGRILFLSHSPPLWLTVVVQVLFRRARGECQNSPDHCTRSVQPGSSLFDMAFHFGDDLLELGISVKRLEV
jgi:hypothetical protein